MQEGTPDIDTAELSAKWRFTVVDDDPIVNRLAIITLQKVIPEPHYLSFNDGQEFCDYLQQGLKHDKSALSPQVVLLDISMPKMDGLEVLKYIEANKLGESLRVVMFTSSVNQSDREACEAYDFVIDYIEKPLKRDKLERSLARLLN